jgi:L-seryl-tRNA(Ser) seleniumtransferase
LLTRLTHAESALVVNNNASAVLLVLSALGKGKQAVIARSQLVEIGGGFRIPDVMKQSGIRLVEVGTTNRVHLNDYQEAFSSGVRIVVRAHSSNFRIIGFTSEPELSEISIAVHQHGGILIDDLGSGALLDTAAFGLGHEPMVQESLQAGADVVCFSGDKLLGGPQAGIILGKKELLARIRKHPLARAVRADKLCLAAMNATLLHYLRDEATCEIPVWCMISRSIEGIRQEAEKWKQQAGLGTVEPSESTVGGGSLPGETLPTYVLSLPVPQPNKFMQSLRHQPVPVIARVWQDKVILDPRTVLPGQDDLVIQALKTILQKR